MKKDLYKTRDYLVSGESFSIRWDDSKGYAVTHPQPSQEELGAYYESDAYISHNASGLGLVAFLYRLARNFMFRVKHKMFKNELPKNASVLDYGCGTGAFLEFISSCGYSSFGIETNLYAREQSIHKRLNVVESWRGLTQSHYDLISMWHVLEHVPDLNECIQEAEKRLKSNGVFLIAIPNLKSFDAQYYKEFWAAYDVPRHLWHFSQRGIQQLIEPYGFELIAKHPLILDALYIAYISEKHKGSRFSLLKGILRGLQSNWKARKTGEYSSLVYLFRKTN